MDRGGEHGHDQENWFEPEDSEVVRRLKGLFLEISGTQLSAVQAARLAGLDPDDCRRVLEVLEEARFVGRGRRGLFVRRSSDSPAD